jgi:hypothetical protein
MLDILLDETLREKKERVRRILNSSLPFKEKIALYIDIVVDYGLTYPYLDNFIISETASKPAKLKSFCSNDRMKSSDLIRKELAAEIKHGKLPEMSAEHFMVNLSSLCHYPLLAKPVLQAIHGLTDTAYRKFLLERKRIIFQTIFNEEMPDLSKEHTKQLS